MIRFTRFTFAALTGCLAVCGFTSFNGVRASERPNIVVMLADDMGFGELQCLNPTRGKIKTPQLDAIAASGMTFADAHSGSSVCTPTRYGLMTGRYAWRTRLQSGVLTGGESLIATGRLTLAKLLRQQGYHTAVIGKWHLGTLFDGEHVSGKVRVGSTVTHGPLDRGGFDEFHGFHHARQIRTWIDNDTVTQDLEPIEMLPKLTEAAVRYINGRKRFDQPFFLYVPWSSPHSPVVPSPAWEGKSGLNKHADFVMQTDDSFGKVVQALRNNGVLENTLIICSSDNGTSAPTSKLVQLQAKGHYPSGDLRGSKADIWDGGHRVPFFVSWPGVVEPGSRCEKLVCLTDVTRTVAAILDVELADNVAEDSYSFLPALRGQTNHDRRDVIHHSISGYFAIRRDNWKLSCCPASGGWTAPRPTAAAWEKFKLEGLPMVQLNDMTLDLGEKTNLALKQPNKVKALRALLDEQIARGRSTPGNSQANDMKIVVDKQPGKKRRTKNKTKGKNKTKEG
ncbi:MAG: arylsulfatase [Pirellulaceae bacterium]|nr:arylsulfatase [Pirellulaceae bacterium]MDP6556899.1 arylsulfatase [Pirellulaceae bacterium]